MSLKTIAIQLAAMCCLGLVCVATALFGWAYRRAETNPDVPTPRQSRCPFFREP